MKRNTKSLQLHNLLIFLLFIFGTTSYAQVGIGTTTPTWQFQMVNTGTVGANATMAEYRNSSASGVSLTSVNLGLANGYNAIEGGTYGTFSGVYGLGASDDSGNIYDANGVYGHANDYQGVGVYGVRSGAGGLNTGFGGLFIADLGYTGALTALSDRRLKKNISPISNSLSAIMNLNPVVLIFGCRKTY